MSSSTEFTNGNVLGLRIVSARKTEAGRQETPGSERTGKSLQMFEEGLPCIEHALKEQLISTPIKDNEH